MPARNLPCLWGFTSTLASGCASSPSFERSDTHLEPEPQRAEREPFGLQQLTASRLPLMRSFTRLLKSLTRAAVCSRSNSSGSLGWVGLGDGRESSSRYWPSYAFESEVTAKPVARKSRESEPSVKYVQCS